MERKRRKKFIGEIVWSATKQGSFQRAHIYRPKANIGANEKRKLRDQIKSFCFKNLYESYERSSITENELISQIEDLMEIITENFTDILKNGEFQFGNAQKFVNLYLKFLWAIGEIKEPPHFPVDRIIQKGFKPIRPWTNMNKEDYLKVIEEARRQIGDKKSLAEWEIIEYEKMINRK